MRIAYFATQDSKIQYNPKEKILRWKRDEGAIGYVWKHETMGVFCSANQAEWYELISTLTDKKKPIVNLIKSVVSAPIFDDSGKIIIAIITLDSRSDLSQSLFNDDDVQNLLRKYVGVLKPLCPNDGCTALGR